MELRDGAHAEAARRDARRHAIEADHLSGVGEQRLHRRGIEVIVMQVRDEDRAPFRRRLERHDRPLPRAVPDRRRDPRVDEERRRRPFDAQAGPRQALDAQRRRRCDFGRARELREETGRRE
jgi:hypothetical protein